MKIVFADVYKYSKLGLVWAGIFAVASIGVLVLNVNHNSVPTVNALVSSSNTFVNSTNKNEDMAFVKVNSILDNVQTSTSNLKDASTNFYPLMRDVRLSVDNINTSALDERFYFEHTLPGVTADVTKILTNSNKSVDDVNIALTDTQTIIKGIGPIEKDLGTTVKSLNYFLNSTTLTTTMSNIEKTTDSASIATNAIAKTAVNIQNQENDYSRGFLNRLFRRIF